ncbi:cytochrome c biogenesis protein CcdA [Anaerofustis sp. HA2171]|uniref:cytochrome c biogenesis protein CcdA n=1 Tax=Anaerofustis butyriciformans TaxID=3108533 RepID=UPI002E35DB43|nr:cytochrome c biogenesis protein CcdA [Anaerofustis sp. HA2171]
MNQLIESLSNIIASSSVFAPLFAFLAGILVSFTPCSLSSIPLIVGYVGLNSKKETKNLFLLSVVFALGTALTFTLFGVVSALIGNILSLSGKWFYIFLGIIMVLMALQTLELYNFIPSTNLVAKNGKTGYIGAFICGILAGVFSSPCSTPALVVILSFVASKGSLLMGIIMLFCYSVGHGILTVLVGTGIGFTKNLNKSEKYAKVQFVVKILLSILMLLIAFYMFYLGF